MLGRKLWKCVGVAIPVAVVAFAAWTPSVVAQEKKASPKSELKSIVATAAADKEFTTFTKLLKAADLTKALEEEGPYTVFAPTDEAFKKLGNETLEDLMKPENKAKLQNILKYHVVKGKHAATDVGAMKTAKTLQGGELTIATKDGKTTIDGAHITKADTMCSNGVIHAIDTVCMPKTPN